ncbi:MAG: riboflavin synthase [Candidatus Coatesbacteria bacterium]
MFSGIVEALGRVERIDRTAKGATITIEAGAFGRRVRASESVCTSGVCLTVVKKRGARFTVQLVPETLRVTSLGGLRAGSRVDLEASLRLNSLIGGHLVVGHVDGVGIVTQFDREGTGRRIRIRPPRELAKYIALKGSVAVNGVSLTVARVTGDTFEIALIPYTLSHTTLGDAAPGARVNIEVDLIARYVERLLAARRH